MRISISCRPFTEKNTVEIEKQQSHPRRAQQSHPRRQSAAVLPSLAPHESKARLQDVTICRRFMAKPCTPHPHCAACAVIRATNCQCRGSRGSPLVLSLGGVRGIFSFREREYPPYLAAAPSAAPPLRAARGTLPVFLFRETKSPRRDRRGLLAVLCVYF